MRRRLEEKVSRGQQTSARRYGIRPTGAARGSESSSSAIIVTILATSIRFPVLYVIFFFILKCRCIFSRAAVYAAYVARFFWCLVHGGVLAILLNTPSQIWVALRQHNIAFCVCFFGKASERSPCTAILPVT